MMWWILLVASLVGSALIYWPLYHWFCRWVESGDENNEVERIVVTMKDGREIVHTPRRPEVVR